MPQNYLKDFKNPPACFRGAPFWAWNCKLEKEMLLKQIDYFKEMGMGGFTIHCRTGLDTPYMGEEYLDIVKACVKKAKECGMKAYLYDEDRWPSGYGGGEVTKAPRYRSRYLVFTPTRAKDRGPDKGQGPGTSSARERVKGDGTLLARYEVILEEGRLKAYRRLAEGEAGENVWYAYLEISAGSAWFNHQAYVNTLDKKAIERFIETTHEKYYAAVGGDFGGAIPSIFTDEPQFPRKSTLGRACEKKDIILPYTDDFEDSYRERYRESFLNHLPEVFWELPDNRVSVTRYRYHDHLTERFACAVSDTLGEWCEKHKIALTGHMMEEPTLYSQTAAVDEAMRNYRGFQIPGIDMLCDGREYTTAKQAQSAAHQMGRNEITSELYGVTNWDFDFRGHKLQGDWQAALGVTHRVHHLSWASMAGEAKRDYPASIFYQSPWYKKYNELETYFGRVNTAMQSGRPKVRIGVIHPIESYWLYFGPEEQTAVIRRRLQTQFEQVTQWLLFGLLDFDYISEALTASLEDNTEQRADKPDASAGTGGFFKDNTEQGAGTSAGMQGSLEADSEQKSFTVGRMSYDAVVIPGCKTLRRTTLKRLQSFSEAGGRIIVMGDAPSMLDAVPSILPRQFIERAAHIDFDYGRLMEALSPYRLVDIRNENGVRSDKYLYQLREDGENLLLFIANGRRVQNRDVPKPDNYTITISGTYQVTLLDALTGEMHPVRAHYGNNTTVLSRQLYEHDSLLLKLTKIIQKPGAISEAAGIDASGAVPTDISEAALRQGDGKSQLAQSLNTVASYRLSEPNVLLLDQAEYSLDKEAFHKSEEVLRIDNIIRTRLHDPLKTEALAQPWTCPQKPEGAHILTLRYTFRSELAVPEAKLAMECPEDAQITFNGEKLKKVSEGYFVDESIRTLPLPAIKPGANELLITMPYSRNTNLEWCYLLGDFGVQIYGNRAKIVKKPEEIGFGDLTAQSFPFYAGNITYFCDIEMEEGDYELEATKFRAPLLSVLLDGKEVGDIMFSPYRISLGHLSGKHRLGITSYGNRVNAFGTVHNCDDTMSWFGPNAWRLEGAQYSYEYQLKRTGILAAPKLYRKIGI